MSAPTDPTRRHDATQNDATDILNGNRPKQIAHDPLSAPTLDPVGHMGGAAPTLDPATRPGEIILTGRDFGDYELLEEVARGAMGVVFRARQKSIPRTVALKMILAGQLASPEQVRRFHTEAEEAGQIDHPNVVPIYQTGEHAGQHYFAMKLIEGGCLSTAVAGFKDRPWDAARLVVKIARAVHFAHQRGILHRDLKPGNILLDQNGEPHVTDFGLAKHLEGGAAATKSGSVMGTPSYMSPEQALARKDLTTATDVYSLGAVLYELLAGRPPFLADTALDTLNQVIDKEPVPPHSIRASIPRDLETICLKCLDKDPARRYASAAALADDLDRSIAGEPIQARPVGRLTRIRLWARRRPAQAGLVAVSGLAFIALFAFGVWHNRSLQQALNLADEQRREAEIQRAQAQRNEKEALAQQVRANANFQRARDAVDGLLTRVVEGRLAHIAGMQLVRLEFLRDAQGFYDYFLSEKSDDPAIRQEAARAYRRIGDVSRLAKSYPKGEESYKKAIDLQAKLVADYPENAIYRDDLAVSYRNLGELQKAAENVEAAAAAFRQSVSVRTELPANHPRAVDYQHRKALTHYDLAQVLKKANENEEAEREYRKAIELQQSLCTAHADIALYSAELGNSTHALAQLISDAGNAAEARSLMDKAIDAERTACRLDPTNSTYRNNLKLQSERRANFHRDQRDHAALAQAGEDWQKDFAGSSVGLFQAACHFGSAAAMASAEPENARRYADRAAAILKEAVSLGYANRAGIAQEADFIALRDRSDFQKILTDLEKINPDGQLNPAREYFAILGEYQAAQQEYTKAAAQARTPEDTKQLATKIPKVGDFANRLMDLAERSPEAPTTFDALVWIVTKATNPSFNALRERAITKLSDQHINNPQLTVVCPLLVSPANDASTGTGKTTPAGDLLLQRLIEQSPHRDVRGLALFAQSEGVKRKYDAATRSKKPESEELSRQMEKMYDRITTEFGDVKRGTSTLGAVVTPDLNEIRYLAVGKQAPEIEGNDVDGKPFKLSEFKGKVVVLDFWADWCPYCKQMYPQERELVKRLADKPFALLGVNSDDDLDELKKVVEKDQINWRSWVDGGPKGGRIRRTYNIKAYPTLYIIDHKGVIRHRQRGAMKGPDMDKLVDELLAEMKAESAGDK